MNTPDMVDAAIRTFKPDAVPDVDYRLQDDGSGQFIAHWNSAKLGPKPRIDQLPDGSAQQAEDEEDRRARRISSTDAEIVDALDKLTRGESPDLTELKARRRR